MAVKTDIVGLLIYVAIVAHLAAAAALALRRDRFGWSAYGAGFALAATAFVARWVRVQHVPLQSLFEVFLCLGMVMGPVSLLCRRLLGVGGEAADCVIASVVLFAAGFVFESRPQPLPSILQSGLFLPHVAAYMAAYMILAKAGVQAFKALGVGGRSQPAAVVAPEVGAYRVVNLGFPLLTLGLVLGALWGKRAWGDWWNWDHKELWSLATWLIYAGYLHFRRAFGRRYPRVGPALVLAGAAGIVITLLWVNLAGTFAGLHSYAK